MAVEDRGGFPRSRLEVRRMPREVGDPGYRLPAAEYRLHHCSEVFRNGGTNLCSCRSGENRAAPARRPMKHPRFPRLGPDGRSAPGDDSWRIGHHWTTGAP